MDETIILLILCWGIDVGCKSGSVGDWLYQNKRKTTTRKQNKRKQQNKQFVKLILN